jgi:SWI/SNF-related matrix-associated actin-dependent regulator 1 of chromatin subfamily A
MSAIQSILKWFGFGPGPRRLNTRRALPSRWAEDPVEESFLTTPFKYQREAAAQIERFGGRALLADEMGLGKTLEALLWRRRTPEATPTVVVCPANVKYTWEAEAINHMGVRALVLEGMKPSQTVGLARPELVIVNYDILSAWLPYLKQLKPQLVIPDECHYLSNRKTKRYKATRELCRGVPYVIGISGTALVNRPAELWPMLNILRPDLFPAFWPFVERYCAPRMRPWGLDTSGAANLRELHEILSDNIMIRRLKRDVLHELPAKQRLVVPMPMSDPKEYRDAVRDFFGWLAKESPGKVMGARKAEALTRVGYLKRLAARLKLPAVVEWIENMRRETGEKLLVYGVHRLMLGALKEKFPDSVSINGEVTGRERQKAIDAFNNDPRTRYCFANIRAGGVGWSCKSTATTAFVELDWTPGAHTQAEDRTHGVGRGVAGTKCRSFYLVAHGTIEERLCKLIQNKQAVLDQVLDGGPAAARDFNLLDLLLMEMVKGRAA